MFGGGGGCRDLTRTLRSLLHHLAHLCTQTDVKTETACHAHARTRTPRPVQVKRSLSVTCNRYSRASLAHRGRCRLKLSDTRGTQRPTSHARPCMHACTNNALQGASNEQTERTPNRTARQTNERANERTTEGAKARTKGGRRRSCVVDFARHRDFVCTTRRNAPAHTPTRQRCGCGWVGRRRVRSLA